LLELRSGIGDGDEVVGGVGRADGLLRALIEIAEERVGLGRRPRLRGDDESERAMSRPSSSALICCGSVESSTCSAG